VGPTRRLTLPLGIRADQMAQGFGSMDHEIILGLENSVAQRAGITGRGGERQYRHSAPRIQEQLQDKSHLAA